MSEFKYKCEKVHEGNPESIEKLAEFLKSKYVGSRKKGEWRALATIIASSNEGYISGFWGEIRWQHEDGQFDSGDVNLTIS